MAQSTIVQEMLWDFNYETWKACMRSYLLSHGLWDVVIKGSTSSREGWNEKNAEALHAIQISCAPHILYQIRNITSAKIAWKTLVDRQNQLLSNSDAHYSDNETESSGDGKQLVPLLAGPMSDEETHLLKEMLKCMDDDNWTDLNKTLQQNPYAIFVQIPQTGETLLHKAVGSRKVKIVKKLVSSMSEEYLEKKSIFGATALATGIALRSLEMVECMVKKNLNLVTSEEAIGTIKTIPLVLACCYTGDKKTTYYLYSITPLESLTKENGYHGSLFLQGCIDRHFFDLAFDLLERDPQLSVAIGGESSPLIRMSNLPEAFYSGCGLSFWQRWIYNFITVQPVPAFQPGCVPVCDSTSDSKNIVQQVSSRFLEILGIKRLYDLKFNHTNLRELLRLCCEVLSELDGQKFRDFRVSTAFKSVIQFGMEEFFREMVKARPQLINSLDEDARSIFMQAILYRQEKIFSFFYGVKGKEAHAFLSDEYSTAMLHLVAKLSPSFRLARISGAALHMQRELQWYKEVEGIVNPRVRGLTNEDGHTPRELFSISHKDLLTEGENWMKQTATSSTVVGALIITIMFTAAFTVPGGYSQDTGLPIFLYTKSFLTFVISDAISLFASTTSVLMFLAILTSRYREEDFLESLPKKLIIGLSTLFISIAAMMVAFCSTLIIILDGKLLIVILIILLASFPVILFIFLQFPLLVEIFMSTYGPSIFNKKVKL